MKYFLKVAEGVDVNPLVSEIEAHPELWDQHGFRKSMTPHARMSDIWVRYNAIENLGPRFNDEHDSVWYPGALPSIRRACFDMMALTDGERLGGVLITKIPPGCGIAAHKDAGWHVDYYSKFYLSLKSGLGADFYCGDEAINPRPGDVYLFDNRAEHWVKNEGKDDRMTLIVCIRTEKYRGAT